MNLYDWLYTFIKWVADERPLVFWTTMLASLALLLFVLRLEILWLS